MIIHSGVSFLYYIGNSYSLCGILRDPSITLLLRTISDTFVVPQILQPF